MQKVSKPPAQGRGRRSGQNKASGAKLSIEEIFQSCVDFLWRLTCEGVRIILKVRLKREAQCIFLMDLSHRPPAPILVQRGGRILMLFHPTGEIVTRSEALATGKNSVEASGGPPSEVSSEIISTAIKISDEGEGQRIVRARHAIAAVNIVKRLVVQDHESRKVDLAELLKRHQCIRRVYTSRSFIHRSQQFAQVTLTLRPDGSDYHDS